MIVQSAGLIAALSAMYILSLKPGKQRPDKFKPFEKKMIAHRGLYDNDSEAPENSLAAFRKAVDANFGVELDVQLTADGKLVVFHDKTLERMCGADKVLTKLTYDELSRYTLADSDQHIPLFEDVFSIFRDKVPAMIELKAHGDYIGTARKLMEYLDDYKGIYCIQSFHPRVVHWFRKNRPEILRGQLATVYDRTAKAPLIVKFFSTNLMTNFYAKPDFISYDVRYESQFSYRMLRRIYKVENAAWTIQSKEQLREAEKHFNIYIFDSFDPRELN